MHSLAKQEIDNGLPFGTVLTKESLRSLHGKKTTWEKVKGIFSKNK